MGFTLSKLAYWKTWTDRDIIWAEDRLPSASLLSYDNLKSSFFQTRSALGSAPRLPSPGEVLQRNAGEGYGVIKYEELNLVVKYGSPSELRVEGAVAMHAIQQAFSRDDIPVPELFGWRTYDRKSFIYMELLPGTTLSQTWSDLTEVEKVLIARELKQIVANLRSIKPPRDLNHIGSVGGGPVLDNFFRDTNYEGPYSTVFDFNNGVIYAALPNSPLSERKYKTPFRELLCDEYHVYLTHADLNLANVLVSGSKGARHVSGIIDWDQAGWYPEYWEHCKMARGIHHEHEWWTRGYLELVTGAYPDELTAILQYMSWRGGF